MDLLVVPTGEGWFAMKDIDLTGVKSIMLMAGWQGLPSAGLKFELRSGAPDGELLGTGIMPKPVPGQQGGAIVIPLQKAISEKVSGLYFVHKPIEGEDRGPGPMALMNATFN